MKKENNLFKIIFTTPVIIYSIVLIFIPLVYILFLSFCKSDSYGGIIYNFSFDNYLTIFNMTYLKVFLKSFLIGIITTFLCILITGKNRSRRLLRNRFAWLILIRIFKYYRRFGK